MQGRIARRRPKDVDDAFKYAMDENRLTQELAMLTDHSKAIPEPMDCNAVTTPQASRELSEVKELLKELVLVQRDQFQVQPQHAPQTNYPPPHAPHTTPRYAPHVGPTRYAPHAGPPRQHGSPHAHQKYQWTADQRPICAFCGFVGHVHRVCRKRQQPTEHGHHHHYHKVRDVQRTATRNRETGKASHPTEKGGARNSSSTKGKRKFSVH